MTLPDPKLLSDMAKTAFELGYVRAKFASTPEGQEQVKERLVDVYQYSCNDQDWRKMHWIKFRAIYGAGFDIGRLHWRIQRGEVE